MVMWGQSRVVGWDWGDRSEATRPTVHACIHTKITRARKKERDTHSLLECLSRAADVSLQCAIVLQNIDKKKKKTHLLQCEPVETEMGFTLLALCGEGEEKHLEMTAAGATEKLRETWERIVFILFLSLLFLSSGQKQQIQSQYFSQSARPADTYCPEKVRAVGPERFPSTYLLPPSVMTGHVISRLPPPPPPPRANDRSR